MSQRTSRATRSAAALAGALLCIAGVAVGAPIDALNVELATTLDFHEATHLEFMDRVVDLDGDGTPEPRTFALAGSRSTEEGGLRIIDITDPEQPALVSHQLCKVGPADVASVRAGDRWYALLGSSGVCTFKPTPTTSIKGDAVFVWDVTDPRNPIPLGWPRTSGTFAEGAHTIVAHPTAPVVYIASQNLADRTPSIFIADLSTWPPVGKEAPILLADPEAREVAFPNGIAPHDITFNADGTRAYASSVDATFIIDTTDPLNPEPVPIATIVDPEIRIHHEAVLHPNGRHLLIVDEFVAAPPAGTPVCPGGGVIVYDLGPDGTLEQTPVKVGSFYANDHTPTVLDETHNYANQGVDPSCTAHEFQISPDGRWMPIGWMAGGVRVFDLQPLIDATEAPLPVPVVVSEAGHWRIPENDIWAAKWHPSHPGYIFASDTALDPGPDVEGRMAGGFKVFRFRLEPPAG